MSALSIQNFESVTLSLRPSAQTLKSDLLLLADSISSVNDPESQDACAKALGSVNQLLREVEKSRTDIKAPVLALERNIDSIAKSFGLELEAHKVRLSGLLSKYQAEIQRIQREAEAKRAAEAARIDRERQKAEQDARDKAAAEARRIEAERLKAQREAEEIERIRTAKAKSEIQKQIAAYEAQEQIKAANAAADAAKAKAEADARAMSDRAEVQRLQALAAPAPVAARKSAGMVVKTVWKFEVEDLDALVSNRRDLCRIEANASAINAAIKNGVREIDGLRIWEEVDASVRVGGAK